MQMFSFPRKGWGLLVFLGLMSFAVVCGAGQIECTETAATQQEHNQCAASRLKSVDDELNRIYQEVLSKYKADREFLEKLRKAQRAWVAFRDDELEARFPMENKQSHYGSVYPMCANLFLVRRTEERIKQLKEWLDGVEEGDVCAGSVHYKPAP
ncbi:MAG: lysozyme inhibitor LprI family protein [Gammaproteobacteria bacterium]